MQAAATVQQKMRS